ncbi:probable inactive receptor kinase [Tanacetum coccineum]
MELYLFEALSLSLLFLLIIPLSIDDLSSTKVALLNFAAIVPQGQKVTWRSKTPVCTSWAGVSCYGKRVTMLRLSGIGVPVSYLQEFSTNQYSHFDDSHVTPVSEGDIRTSAAYLLFYQRVKTKPDESMGESSKLHYGPIPPNTLGDLDSLTILSLHSNFLNGSLPSDLLSLPSLSNIKAC